MDPPPENLPRGTLQVGGLELFYSYARVRELRKSDALTHQIDRVAPVARRYRVEPGTDEAGSRRGSSDAAATLFPPPQALERKTSAAAKPTPPPNLPAADICLLPFRKRE